MPHVYSTEWNEIDGTYLFSDAGSESIATQTSVMSYFMKFWHSYQIPTLAMRLEPSKQWFRVQILMI